MKSVKNVKNHPPSLSLALLASRGSPLAMWQTRWVIRQLEAVSPAHLSWKILPVSSLADLHPTWSMSKLQGAYAQGAKGGFVRALENTLANDQAQGAVHSLKDLPVTSSADLHLAAICKRHTPWDVCVVPRSVRGRCSPPQRFLQPKHLRAFAGSTFATSSLRRQALLREVGITTVDIRGNIGTRLEKVLQHPAKFQGLVLSGAGVVRLGLSSSLFRSQLRQFQVCALDPAWFVPAPGQGVVAVQSTPHSPLGAVFDRISCPVTSYCVQLERAVVAMLGGSCMLPFGCYAHILKSPHGQGQQHGRVQVCWWVFVASGDGDVIRERLSHEYILKSDCDVFFVLQSRIPDLVDITMHRLRAAGVEGVLSKLNLPCPWK